MANIKFNITGPDHATGLFKLERVTLTKRKYWVGFHKDTRFMSYHRSYQQAHMSKLRQYLKLGINQ